MAKCPTLAFYNYHSGYWVQNNQKMKHLMLIMALCAVVIACKKKKEDPAPEPEKPVCATMPAVFAGKFYTVEWQHHDTITIDFISDRCPSAPKSNYYMIHKLGEAVQFAVNPGNTFEAGRDYGLISNEPMSMASISNMSFMLQDSLLNFTCDKLTHSIVFKRFK